MITTEFNEDQGLLTLTLNEDLLSSNADRAQEAFEKALMQAPKYRDLCIDLCRCKIVDSVGLNLLFGLLHRAKEMGADPWVAVARGTLEHVMHVARVDKIFKVEVKEPVAPSVTTAKTHGKKP